MDKYECAFNSKKKQTIIEKWLQPKEWKMLGQSAK